jgi:hypothetical protein
MRVRSLRKVPQPGSDPKPGQIEWVISPRFKIFPGSLDIRKVPQALHADVDDPIMIYRRIDSHHTQQSGGPQATGRCIGR